MKAMLFAAGLGSRLKPFTDTHPKALAMINGKSLLQRNIEFLQTFDIHEIIINVHHFAAQVISTLEKNDGFGSNIAISDETNRILETGGGLKKAGWFLKDDNPFVVMNADILTDMDMRAMINAYFKMRPFATLAVTERTTSRYFLFDESGDLCGWKNEQTGAQKMSREIAIHSKKAFSGIHVISPEIFTFMNDPANGYAGEEKFSLVDLYLDLSKNNRIMAFDHSNSKFIDVGKPQSIAEAELMFV